MNNIMWYNIYRKKEWGKMTLKEYYNKLKKEKIELECKDKGEYFGGSKLTDEDKKRYKVIVEEMNLIKKNKPYIGCK